MITSLSREKLVELGSHFRGDYLAEQAGYTLGIAALDGKALEELLPSGFVQEVAEALEAVNRARQDKALTHQESKDATQAQKLAVREAKLWRRRVSKRAAAAARMGQAMPEGLIKIGRGRTQPELAAQVVEMTKLLESALPSLHGAGTDVLLKEGLTLCATLQAADATQEVKRFKEMPDAVQDYYVQKALLYTGLKVIQDAGQELHASDPASAARYNHAILYRRAGKREAAPEEAPAIPAPQEPGA